LTYANLVATLALVIATGGTAVAAVMITSNSQVGQNTISGHAAPSGKHPNLIVGSVNGTDLAGGVKSSFTLHCPGGMQEAADLCFETSVRAQTSWTNALATCANAQRRLPNVAELAEVFDHTGAPQGSQWTQDSFLQANGLRVATILDEDSSRTIGFADAGTTAGLSPYRCVVAPSN
jgi:hypothetical protein